MHKLNGSTLVISSLLALLGAFACSSDSGGNNNAGNGVVSPFGSSAGSTGTSSDPNQPGPSASSGGTTGVSGTGETPINPALNAGGTASIGAGGAGATGPVEDVIAEPGPGFFTSAAWKGYAWTAIETDPVTGATTRDPLDFTTLAKGSPFCLKGTVAADPPSSATANDGYQGFAMMGFNIAQAGVSAVEGVEPPVGTSVPTGAGIAFNFAQRTGPLRVQLQGADPTNGAQRWCAAVPPADAQGRAFIPYTAFHNTCYDAASLLPAGNAGFYDHPGGTRAPIAAVSFLVPGDTVTVPYDFCINWFGDGSSIADAVTDPNFSGGGLIQGTLATNFRRAKVRGTDGKSYVVQNNAWNPGAVEGAQRLQFEGNSFTVAQQSNGSFGNIPISFPSVFIGQNGNRGVNEEFTTKEDDGLPKALNAITSIPTTFNNNGGAVAGEYNVTYDIWFANTAPQGVYEDASAAFLMVWLYKPGGKNPIGLNPAIQNVTIAGAPGTWDIWIGPRGENGAENNLNNDAPVISYVARAPIQNFQADLKKFMDDAVARSTAGTLKAANGRSFTFANNLVLTDVFGGSEIWSGGQGLSISNFTVHVQ
jgi:hypothetical protein